MKKTKNQLIIFLLLACILCSTIVHALIIDTDVHIYSPTSAVHVTFLEQTNVTFLDVDDTYFKINNINMSLSMSGSADINISTFNSTSSTLTVGTSVLRFNITHTGDAVGFDFRGNHSHASYNVFVDSVAYTHVDYVNRVTFSINSWSSHDVDIRFAGYIPDPPFNGSSIYYNGTNYDNLSWDRGNHSDQEIVVGGSEGYPSSPSDGTVFQNGTDQWYNFSVNQTMFFTIWSYNSSTNTYSSTGLNMEWGALRINVFNASTPWEQVSPFGIIIQNSAGDETYTNPIVSPPLYLDINDIPFGLNTMFILNASRYALSTFHNDTVINHFYNLTFLMVPLETSTPGEGDVDPVTGEPGNTTSYQNYVIIVKDQLDQYVGGALVQVKQYNNVTDTYNQIGSGLTSDGGLFSISLVPNVLYQITVSKNGYITSDENYWTPDRIEFTDDRYYTIVLPFDEIDPYAGMQPFDYIDCCGISSRTNSTLYLNFTDETGGIIDLQTYVYEINTSTGARVLFYSNTSITESNWSLILNSLDTNSSYQVFVWYNHSIFGSQKFTCMYEGYKKGLTTPGKINAILTGIFGVNPLVWTHLLMFCFMVAGFFYADQKDCGKVLIILGGFFLFINIILGFDDALTLAAGGIIPSLFIIVGLLLEWMNHQRNQGGG